MKKLLLLLVLATTFGTAFSMKRKRENDSYDNKVLKRNTFEKKRKISKENSFPAIIEVNISLAEYAGILVEAIKNGNVLLVKITLESIQNVYLKHALVNMYVDEKHLLYYAIRKQKEFLTKKVKFEIVSLLLKHGSNRMSPHRLDKDRGISVLQVIDHDLKLGKKYPKIVALLDKQNPGKITKKKKKNSVKGRYLKPTRLFGE